MQLVINSLGGRHTHTHTDVCTETFKETRCPPAYGRHTPGLKIDNLFVLRWLIFADLVTYAYMQVYYYILYLSE